MMPQAEAGTASPSAACIACAAGLMLLFAYPAHGQQIAPRYVHEAWTVEDGLPVNAISGLLQTRDGYLWLATFDGLVRFDGVRFTVYNAGNTEGLPSNRIIDLLEAQDGSLWMRTAQHQLVRSRDGHFTHYGPEEGLLSDRAGALYEEPDGTLLIGTSRGVLRHHDGYLIPFCCEELSDPATALLRDRTGTLWIGTSGSLYAYRAGALAPLTLNGEPWQGHVTHLYAHPSLDALWVGTMEGLYQYRNDHLTRFEEENKEQSSPGTVRREPAGHLWIASGNRLYQDGQPVFEAPSGITGFLHDHEGSLWIATAGSGLHRLKPSLFSVYSKPEGLPGRNVYAVFEDRGGAYWFGTLGSGLSRFVPSPRMQGPGSAQAQSEGAGAGVFTTYTTEDGLPSNSVLSIYQDHAGNVWVGTYNHGVCRLEQSTCTAHHLDGLLVPAITEDRTGTLWFGTSNGLYRYRSGSWRRYGIEDGLSHTYIRAIHEGRDGALWLGTNGGGIIRFKDGRFTPFMKAHGLSSNTIRSIYQDREDLLWIGTEDRGLCRIDLRHAADLYDANVHVYLPRDGLFDEVIHTILEDDHGRLWMSTNRGIFWVDRAELNLFAEGKVDRIHATVYTERDGMRNREANGGVQQAGLKARDGRLWFATQDGAVVVDPSDIRRNEVPPPVAIEQLAAGGTVLTAPSTAALGPGQRSFEIAYTGLSFMAPENMRFRYRLEGFDKGWIEAGRRRVAYYTNVPPGQYTFRVAASNNDGVWNEAGASLAIKVAPFFHETGWFYIVCMLALVLLVWAGYRGRLRQLKAREQELKALVAARTAEMEAQNAQLEAQNAKIETQARQLAELDQAKSRFFANISHEFRTPLTLVIGPLESALAGAYGPTSRALHEQHQMMLRNSRRLLRLINQILDLAKLEVGRFQLEARPHNLVPFVRETVGAFLPLAERRGIGLSCHAACARCIAAFDAEQLEKVLTNLLSNALKFTPAGGYVQVTVRAGETFAEIEVADTGIGIPEAELSHVFDRFYQVSASATQKQEGTGIGLALAKDLVELHSGSIRAESEVGKGSRFTVRLPLSPVSVWEDEHQGDGAGRAWPGEEGEAREPPATPAAEDVLPHRPVPSPSEDQTTVLLVDDNADLRAYMRSILQPHYRVLEAEEGAQGLERAREALPDLIISDVMMPVMDGFAFSRALKEDPMLDCIPVILLTARAQARDEIEGLKTGADDYVAKPFEPAVLLARVGNLIALRLRLRERLRLQTLERPEQAQAVEPPFKAQLRRLILEHLADSNLSVEVLASEAALSYSQLHRRLTEEAGVTPGELIRIVRVEEAARLLSEQAGSISEVGYAVGFNSIAHFSRSFRAHFGLAPSEYVRRVASP